jgi:hypothetical protein
VTVDQRIREAACRDVQNDAELRRKVTAAMAFAFERSHHPGTPSVEDGHLFNLAYALLGYQEVLKQLTVDAERLVATLEGA